MRANGAVNLSANLIFNCGFHFKRLLNNADAKGIAKVLPNLRSDRKKMSTVDARPPLVQHEGAMNPIPTKLQLERSPDYREAYANSVQIRVNLWDFFLLFGIANQTAPDNVSIQSFQGIYVSPQQAKALLNVLQQNISQYEATFGEIKLEPQNSETGIVQ